MREITLTFRFKQNSKCLNKGQPDLEIFNVQIETRGARESQILKNTKDRCYDIENAQVSIGGARKSKMQGQGQNSYTSM